MGDIFFVIKMMVYTFFVVVLMQVKIGSQTLEERAIDLTHRSQIGQSLQSVAQSGVQIISYQYQKMMGKVDLKFVKPPSLDQIPGQRLKAKIQTWKEDRKKDLHSLTESDD
jgi:glycine cleavage system protein P-like pyridoxal-binding family